MNRTGLRRLCLAAIAGLYLFSVPWYREADAPLRIFFGLPDWVAVALLCYVGVALLNSLAWSLSDVPDASETAETSEPADGVDPAEAPR